MSVGKCIVNYFKQHICVFIFSIIVVLSVTLLSLVPPQILRIIVDKVIPSKDKNKLLLAAIFYALIFNFYQNSALIFNFCLNFAAFILIF